MTRLGLRIPQLHLPRCRRRRPLGRRCRLAGAGERSGSTSSPRAGRCSGLTPPGTTSSITRWASTFRGWGSGWTASRRRSRSVGRCLGASGRPLREVGPGGRRHHLAGPPRRAARPSVVEGPGEKHAEAGAPPRRRVSLTSGRDELAPRSTSSPGIARTPVGTRPGSTRPGWHRPSSAALERKPRDCATRRDATRCDAGGRGLPAWSSLDDGTRVMLGARGDRHADDIATQVGGGGDRARS